MLAKPDGQGGAVIAGDPGHPANFGRLCSKGSALGETLGLDNRLLHPMLRAADGTLAPRDVGHARSIVWRTALREPSRSMDLMRSPFISRASC